MQIYWHSNHSRRSGFPGRSGFPSRSGFCSSLLSGCSSFLVVLAIIRSFQSLKSKEIKQGEARQTLAAHCLLQMLSPINFAALPGNKFFS
jgi:hypothetical protein